MKKEKNFNETEFNPYDLDKLAKVPAWIKILLLKYWVAAAAFFFFLIGNPISQGYIDDLERMFNVNFVFLGLGIALFNDIIVRNIVKLMKNSRDDTFKLNMINMRGIPSLFINLAYSYLLLIPAILICAAMSSRGIFVNFLSVSGGMDPLTFAFVYFSLDMICIGIKDLIIYIHLLIKYNKKQEEYKMLEKKLLEGTNEI